MSPHTAIPPGLRVAACPHGSRALRYACQSGLADLNPFLLFIPTIPTPVLESVLTPLSPREPLFSSQKELSNIQNKQSEGRETLIFFYSPSVTVISGVIVTTVGARRPRENTIFRLTVPLKKCSCSQHFSVCCRIPVLILLTLIKSRFKHNCLVPTSSRIIGGVSYFLATIGKSHSQPFVIAM